MKIKSSVAFSCSVIRRYFSGVSRNYVIDPDGEGGLAPFTVHCDMADKNGAGVTVISHDSESRTKVRDGLVRSVITGKSQTSVLMYRPSEASV